MKICLRIWIEHVLHGNAYRVGCIWRFKLYFIGCFLEVFICSEAWMLHCYHCRRTEEIDLFHGHYWHTDALRNEGTVVSKIHVFGPAIEVFLVFQKRTAQAAKTVKHGSNAQISTIPPENYAKRFLDFLESIIVVWVWAFFPVFIGAWWPKYAITLHIQCEQFSTVTTYFYPSGCAVDDHFTRRFGCLHCVQYLDKFLTVKMRTNFV